MDMANRDTTRRSSTVKFNRAPIDIVNGIPVFTSSDKYTLNYDKIAADHLKSLDESGANPFMAEDLWASMEQSTIDLLKEVIEPGDRILDAGVGLGRVLSVFEDHERHGVDITLQYLERAQSVGISVALARLEDIPFSDEAFEIVISTDVLEHVLDFYNASRELVRVLKPGGYLAIRVPFEEDLKAYYDYRDYDFVHVRRFDYWSLRLHFERVMGLRYISHNFVKPVYRGISTSRLRPVDDPEAILAVLSELPADIDGVPQMKGFCQLDSATFESFMNGIAVSHPPIFERLVALVAGYIEITIIFQKP